MANYLDVTYDPYTATAPPVLPPNPGYQGRSPGKILFGIPPEDAGAKARPGISPEHAGEKAATYQAPTAMDCRGFTAPVLGSEICWSDVFAYGVGGLLVIFGLLMVAGGTIFGVSLGRKR